jgi:hypothetical protein
MCQFGSIHNAYVRFSAARYSKLHLEYIYCFLQNKLNYIYDSRFQVITAVFLKIRVFWHVTSFFFVNNCRRFERLWCCRPQGQRKLGLDLLTLKMVYDHLKGQQIFSTHSLRHKPTQKEFTIHPLLPSFYVLWQICIMYKAVYVNQCPTCHFE